MVVLLEQSRVFRTVHGFIHPALAAYVSAVHPSSSCIFVEIYIRNQLVSLTTIVPHQKVRIQGITPDHGLLRTLPDGMGGLGEGFIDLQPDGNSFDMLAGLIKTKT